MTRRLIVNADDFGLTPQVSAGILTAHRHGIVSSTTALVTVAIDDDSVGALRDSGLGVGLSRCWEDEDDRSPLDLLKSA